MLFDSLLALEKEQSIESFLSDALKNNPEFAENYQWIWGALRPYEFLPIRDDDAKFGNTDLDPSLFEEHLQVASARIDESLKRLDEIQRLQALAVASALEYILAEGTEAQNLNLAKLVVKANRKTASASDTDADEADVIRQSQIQAKIRELRLRMHNVKGSLLNYSEIISRQKDLLNLDITEAWVSLNFAKIGLKASGIAEMHYLPPLESGGATDILHQMALWTRSAIHKFENRWKREGVHTGIVRVSNFYKGGKDALIEKLSGELPIVEFELTIRAFPFHLGRHRIQKLCIAIEMSGDDQEFSTAYNATEEKNRSLFSLANSWHREQLDRISFPLRTRLPKQNYPGEDYFLANWKKPDCWSSTEVKVWSGAPSAFLNPTRYYKNADPIGTWRLDFNAQINGASGLQPLSFYAKKTSKTSPLWNVADIVIWMEIASVVL